MTQSPQHQQNFSQFYAENYTWLYGWLCRTLRSPQQVEDVLQDTFLKIFVTPDLIQKIKEPHPFLATTAKHIIISQARRKKLEQDYLHYLEAQQMNTAHMSPEENVLIIETLHRISNALSGLESRPRQVMIMHYLEGITQVEIAAKLELSVKTIRTDLIKAVLYCHRYMQQDQL